MAEIYKRQQPERRVKTQEGELQSKTTIRFSQSRKFPLPSEET